MRESSLVLVEADTDGARGLGGTIGARHLADDGLEEIHEFAYA